MSQNFNFEQSVDNISQNIQSGKPFAAGKIGVNEFKVMLGYHRPDILKKWLATRTIKEYPSEWLYLKNGVYPLNPETEKNFVRIIMQDTRNIDFLPAWIPMGSNADENFIRYHFPQCKIIETRSLEPYYSNAPWTEHLTNKKVLVVSPFVRSIEKQYKKRQLLWKDERILPDFELKTLKHQLSPALGIPSKYDTWFDMLDDIKKQISEIDFDIALIGTGASSLPIAAHCKRLGKQAIHLGGSLQILFGIKGTRWDNKPHINCFYNEHWVRPSGDEIPPNFALNERGCYW